MFGQNNGPGNTYLFCLLSISANKTDNSSHLLLDEH